LIRKVQNEVSKSFDDLDSAASVRRLFKRVLGYTPEDYARSRSDWKAR